MSRSVSSVPLAMLGAPGPPSMFWIVKLPVRLTFAMLLQKYAGEVGSTAASVTMPSVCPEPVAPLWYRPLRLYMLAKSDGRWQPFGRPNSARQEFELPACGLSRLVVGFTAWSAYGL